MLHVALLYTKLNQRPQAIEVLEDYARRRPPSADILVALAKELAAEKRWDEMETALKGAEIKDPRRGSIAVLRGDRLMEERQYQRAVEQYEAAMALDKERLGPEVRAKLAEAQSKAGIGGR